MQKLPYLHHAHPQYIESLYRDYRNNPEAVDLSWRKFFEGYEMALSANGQAAPVSDHILKEFRVLNLIQAYRS
ncbi:MAG: hypothetical protein WAN36_16560, partial [Calditrichia bacterium]